jgi:membrane-bound serine protease (ClpP class)
VCLHRPARPRADADRPGRGSGGAVAYSVGLSGTIDPATERWLGEALEDAADEGAPLVIIRLDTPGGLDSSMRSMVKDIIAAPMPVVVYVSPDGARAASAGLFITQAGDVAAMAPQTNIGSATPVQIGPGDEDEVLGRKVRNDARSSREPSFRRLSS